MEKTTISIFIVSLIFYILFLFFLPNIVGIGTCLGLSIVNIAASISWFGKEKDNKYYRRISLVIMAFNIIVLVLAGSFLLGLYFSPPKINMIG